jgi:protein-S-isoprenylcysteine O-methyltransferase Ste14
MLGLRWFFSRRGWRMSNADTPKVRIFPPLVYLVGLVIGHLANRWLPIDAVPDQGAWIAGGVLVVLGLGLSASAMTNFRRAGTTIRPDRASSTLVIAGPYKFTRNPMYVGMATAYLGLAIADRSLASLILLPVVLLVIRRAVIVHEESFLERRFGSAYTDYKAKVRRWL